MVEKEEQSNHKCLAENNKIQRNLWLNSHQTAPVITIGGLMKNHATLGLGDTVSDYTNSPHNKIP